MDAAEDQNCKDKSEAPPDPPMGPVDVLAASRYGSAMRLIPVLIGCLPCLLALAGCKEEPSAPALASSSPISSASPRAIPSAPPLATPPPAAAQQGVEVEIFGTVTIPAGHEIVGNLQVFVSAKDCADPDAKVLGQVQLSMDKRFFIEVFAPWGTDLTVCASGETRRAGKVAQVLGKADRTFHAEGVGEVIFQNVAIKVAPLPKAK